MNALIDSSAKANKILMVLTSHAELGNTGDKTGFWLEEFAAPYYVFKDAGCIVTLASPRGGQPPLDPKSTASDAQTNATHRFKDDLQTQASLAATRTLRSVSAKSFDAVFYVGGHGPLWDLVDDVHSISLIEQMLAANKPVAAVCHAPVVLRHVKTASGDFAVNNKKLTGFSNSEEQAVGMVDVVPFSLEQALKEGASYSKVGNWQPYVITDGWLITGQNPASSEGAANALLEALKPQRAMPNMTRPDETSAPDYRRRELSPPPSKPVVATQRRARKFA
jgi:putative intracellular protease/amidase